MVSNRVFQSKDSKHGGCNKSGCQSLVVTAYFLEIIGGHVSNFLYRMVIWNLLKRGFASSHGSLV